MANKGLKNYTKQMSGSIGNNVEYFVNVNSTDANMHLMIPLIETIGINPMGLNLIYNYQGRRGTFDFGKGVQTNFDIAISDFDSHIAITNPDGSIDEYIYNSLKSGYACDKTANIIKRNIELVDGDSDIITYKFLDKQGNSMKFDENAYHPTEINFTNGFKVFIEGSQIRNDHGAKIQYTRTNNRVTEVLYTQEGVANNQKIQLTYDSNNNLSTIKKFVCNNLIANISFNFTENSIIVTDELVKYSIKFVLTAEKVTEIQEKFSGDYKKVYSIQYFDKKTKIIDSSDDYQVIVFDDNQLPIFEYDNYYNMIEKEYDVKTFDLKKKSKSINMKELLKNNLITSDDYEAIFTKSNNIDVVYKSNKDPLLIELGCENMYEAYGDGSIKHSLTKENGLVGDNITLAMLGKYNLEYNPDENADIKVILKTYNKDKLVDFKEQTFDNLKTTFDLFTMGFVATATYDRIELEIVLNTDISLYFSDILLLQKDFANLFTYDEHKNITDIIDGNTSSKLSYNSNNLLEEILDEKSESNKFYYDNHMDLVRIDSAYNVKTNNTYDSNHQLISQTTEGVNAIITTTKEYDSYGNMIKTIDSLNNEISYEYDANQFYRLKKIASAASLLYYDYNLDNTIKTMKIASPSQTEESTLNYEYENQNITKVKADNGSIYRFIYDNRNNITNIYLNDVLIYNFTYDDKDRILTMGYGNVNYYHKFFYENGLLMHINYMINTRTYEKYSFIYDALNRVVSITTQESDFSNTIITHFTYTPDNELQEVKEEVESRGKFKEEFKITYSYDNLSSIQNEKIKTEDYERIVSYDSISRSSGSHPDNMYKEYMDKENYLTCFFKENCNLHGKGLTVEAFNTYSGYVKNTVSGIIPCTSLNYQTRLGYTLPFNASNYGSVGFWFHPESMNENSYVFVAAQSTYHTNYSLMAQVNANKQIVLKYMDSTGTTTIVTTTNSINENEWNFFFLIWKDKKIYLSLNGIEKNTSLSKNIVLNNQSLCYFIGHCGYSLSDANPVTCKVAGLIIAKDNPLSINFMKKYYMETQEYLIAKELREDNCSLVNHTVASEYVIDDNIKNSFEIYPLNNNLLSLNGKKPIDFSLRTVGTDKDRTFNFNLVSKRYAFVSDGNMLAYKFGGDNAGTIAMRVFLDIRSKKQYLFYAYNDTNHMGLYANEDGTIYYDVNGASYETTLKLNLKQWHFVACSYSSVISSYVSGTFNIRIMVDDKVYSTTKSLMADLKNLTTVIGRCKDTVCINYGSLVEETSYPLYGQMEMLCHRGAYCESSTIQNLRDLTKMNSMNYHFNELGMLKKKEINNNNQSILSNVISYKQGLYSKETPIEISKETIKYKDTTINRKYGYLNGNVTSISDSIFGSHTYEYNYRGFLTKEDENEINYDKNGNIISYGNRIFTYDTTIKDRLTSVNGRKISYSSSNPLNPNKWGDSTFYTFEGRRLIEYWYLDDDGVDVVYNYEYNSQGLRTHKYNDVDLVSRYYYDGDKLITDYRSENDRLDFLYDNNGLLYGFINNKTDRYYYIRDVFQNILGIVDSAGNLVVKYLYDAYGMTKGIMGDFTIAYRNPFRYKGYYYDDESGMYYCKSRYYVPYWCRWLNGDDINYVNPQNISGVNLFSYCSNNPIMMVDENGHWAIAGFALAAAIVFLIVLLYIACTTKEHHFYTSSESDNSIFGKNNGILIDGLLLWVTEDLDKFNESVRNSFVDYIMSRIVSSKMWDNRDKHHIVAKRDRRAGKARIILEKYGIGINDEINTVYVRKPLHWVVHTNIYHGTLTMNLMIADYLGGEQGVTNVLGVYKAVLGEYGDYKHL